MNQTNPLTLSQFIGVRQLRTIQSLCRGEEGEFFRGKLKALAALVGTMPKTYEQDGKGDTAIVSLHYFAGGQANWWITEKDAETPDEPGQHQAFGLANLFGGIEDAEYGYISIVEILAAGAELDLYFTPCTVGELRAGEFLMNRTNPLASIPASVKPEGKECRLGTSALPVPPAVSALDLALRQAAGLETPAPETPPNIVAFPVPETTAEQEKEAVRQRIQERLGGPVGPVLHVDRTIAEAFGLDKFPASLVVVHPDGDRAAIIGRILEISRRPMPEIVEVFELLGDDGQWRNAGGFPWGVKMVEPVQRRSAGFVIQLRDGTRCGVRLPTRQEQEKRQRESIETACGNFRAELEKMTGPQLESQRVYWEGEAAAKQDRLAPPIKFLPKTKPNKHH